ncbi:MAG: TIM barrel protein [Verrucomicrobia bacterium]|nr:TIM barrel protein [Verrucomicrobiota bacterium]
MSASLFGWALGREQAGSPTHFRASSTREMKHAVATQVTGLLAGLLFTIPIGCVAAADTGLFAHDNLVAWCIVPFDAKKRGPEERAAMLERLGIKRLAYDWRAEHVPTFEAEIEATKKRGIEFTAFWATHEEAFKLFEKRVMKPQIWVTLAGANAPTQEERVELTAKRMLPLVERTRKLGCPLGLYNHGGWGGEPENLIAVAKLLREKHGAAHVGIVYNLHHGHDHLDRFPAVLAAMKPYLLCLNLNGMTKDGDKRGMKILPLGQGDLDLQLLKTIRDSGYRGPIGILNHTGEDAEARLKDNLDGLDWLVAQLDGKPAGPRPQPRSWRPPPPK